MFYMSLSVNNTILHSIYYVINHFKVLLGLNVFENHFNVFFQLSNASWICSETQLFQHTPKTVGSGLLFLGALDKLSSFTKVVLELVIEQCFEILNCCYCFLCSSVYCNFLWRCYLLCRRYHWTSLLMTTLFC